MKKDDFKSMAEYFIEDLRSVDDGSTLTIDELLESIFKDKKKYKDEDFYQLWTELNLAAKKNHIVIESMGNDQTPWKHKFIVHNKNGQIKCPYCGSERTVYILYGLPIPSKRYRKRLDNNQVWLGGCQVGGNMPRRHCLACGQEFASLPFLWNKQKDDFDDYRNIVTKISFDDEWSIGRRTDIEIAKAATMAAVTVHNFPEDTHVTKSITINQWNSLLDQLYCKMFLHEWKKEYADNSILDGEEWSLEIQMTEGRKEKYSGINAFPPYWKDLKSLFRSLEKKINDQEE